MYLFDRKLEKGKAKTCPIENKKERQIETIIGGKNYFKFFQRNYLLHHW